MEKTTTEEKSFDAMLTAGYTPSNIAAGAFTRVATGNTRRAVLKRPRTRRDTQA